MLALPTRLCTCILLNDGRLFAAGGYEDGEKINSVNIFDAKFNSWIPITSMENGRIRPYIVQIGSKVFAVMFLNLFTFVLNIFFYKLNILKLDWWLQWKYGIHNNCRIL